jgi:hypothetical protein
MGRTLASTAQLFLMDYERILNWNICGLNSRAQCNVVVDMAVLERLLLVCIHETKLHVIDDSIIFTVFGPLFDYTYVLVVHTRGGILVVWRRDAWSGSHFYLSSHAITLQFAHVSLGDASWWLTTVYGPHRDQEKEAFL